MNRDALFAMDPNILVSMVNMRLRDRFDSLESYCDDEGISAQDLSEKLKEIGRVYDKSTNQFK